MIVARMPDDELSHPLDTAAGVERTPGTERTTAAGD
jgi:hypothetical protein